MRTTYAWPEESRSIAWGTDGSFARGHLKAFGYSRQPEMPAGRWGLRSAPGALELHPIVVTFAFLLGAQLAGAIGAIVAIPLAAVVQAFVVTYFEQYRAERGWPSPDEDPGVAPPGDATPAVEPAH